jgi:hypothetical protein
MHPSLFCSFLGAAISLFLLIVNPLPGQSFFAAGSDRISRSERAQGKGGVPGSNGSLREKKLNFWPVLDDIGFETEGTVAASHWSQVIFPDIDKMRRKHLRPSLSGYVALR